MVQHLEAVFEHGILRPLEPLALSENQHVLVTISDLSSSKAPEGTSSRTLEQEWLAVHGHEYVGEWLALNGSVLLAHGPRAQKVREEARRLGIPRPLMVRVSEDFDLPSAGWL